MAVLQLKTLSSGATALYWKISHIEIYPDQRRATLRWAGWISEVERAQGLACIAEVVEDVPVSDEVISFGYLYSRPVSIFGAGEPVIDDPENPEPEGDPEP